MGKSALSIQFVRGQFPERYDPTIEDSYRKFIEIEGRAYMLEILDTAGTDQFRSMRDLYMKNGHGFVVCYAINDLYSFDDAHNIVDDVYRVKKSENVSEDEVPIIIVGNKKDLPTDKRRITTENGKRFAEARKALFAETSAKENDGVSEAFERLTVWIGQLNPIKEKRKRKCQIL